MNLQQIFSQSDAIGKAVALLLLLMSIASWVVILWKAWVLRRAGGDVPQDGVGLGEIAAVDFQQRNLPARILRQIFRRATLAAQDVDLDGLIGDVEQRQRKADLVAVAGALHRIEFVHRLSLPASEQSTGGCPRSPRLNNDGECGASQGRCVGKSRNPYRTAVSQDDSIRPGKQRKTIRFTLSPAGANGLQWRDCARRAAAPIHKMSRARSARAEWPWRRRCRVTAAERSRPRRAG